MKTPITYYGGKQKLVKKILPLLPPHTHYIEPFMGGGALFFAKPPSTAETINDNLNNVTNFYDVTKKQFAALKTEIDATLHSRSTYETAREIYHHPENYDAVKRAWAFWVCTNQGFAGRVGSWGLSRDGKIGKTLNNKKQNFTTDYADRLKHTQIENKDALQIIQQYDSPKTFFYIDPPYSNSDCGHYKNYTEADFIQLLELLSTIQGKFLLSHYPNKELNEYIAKNKWHTIALQQRISVNAALQKQKTELIISNYPLPMQQTTTNNTPTEKNAVQKKSEKSKQKVVLHYKKSTPKRLQVQKSHAMFANAPIEDETMPELPSVKLETVHDTKLLMKGQYNNYYVVGALPQDLGSLQITLLCEEQLSGKKERIKLDLYEGSQVKTFAQNLAQQFNQQTEQVEAELITLIDLLEKYRDKQYEQNRTQHSPKRGAMLIHKSTQDQCIEFLSQPNLIENIDKHIEKAGVIGEENTRKLLYITATTYKMPHPLHALVQGSSGTGKKHLINTIAQCLPPEDVLTFTRITSKSFYHYTHDELVNKVILIQDYDGLDEEARYAFGQLQSTEIVSSSTTYKTQNGNILPCVKNVKSHFASLLSTSKTENHYEHLSRSLIIGIDESPAQTQRIITCQNKQLAGLNDTKEEQNARQFLQNMMRCINPCEVVNPYAEKVNLPLEAKQLRRLNTHYQAFVKQITILHQYQRKKDIQGRLIAQKEDLIIATNLLFDAIVLKVDDLYPSLRQFFDNTKTYIKTLPPTDKAEYPSFTQKELRSALKTSKSQCFRYIEELEQMEYIQKTGGYANKGFTYKITCWDDMDKIRETIKQQLNKQLTEIE